ncbi:dipeptide epimerase [Flavobacterium procerum]|uniref:Dipeptide epimerase n=1 Tax=Flavobacterium procerum TaxID=1455569 RepID=A0ABV6BRJ8_9FLAO
MELILKSYNLKLKHTFRISRKTIDFQPSLIVELQDAGFSGYGEATSNPYYNITIDILQKDIQKIKNLITESGSETPEEFWSKISPFLQDNPFALCALDNAYNDLYARKKGEKMYELWHYTIHNNPLTNYTIGIDTVENMVLKMEELPWPIYKIKLGTPDDISIVKELRKHSNSIFRVDANCAWTVQETLENAKELKKLNVEFIEQPLKAEDWEGQREVYKNSVLPIIADESCISEDDVVKCHNHFHGVNIKLMKCGGITPGRRMIGEAKKLGLKTMMGCMTESSVGIAAIAHLLPELDYVDMDGALLLAEDIANGVKIVNGKTFYPDRIGNGVILL